MTLTPALSLTQGEGEPTPTASHKPESLTSSSTLSPDWQSFVDAIAQTKPSLATALEEAAVTMTDDRVTLAFEKNFPQETVTRAVDMLQTAFKSQFNRSVTFETRLDKTISKPAGSSPANATAGPAPSSAAVRRPELPPLPDALELEEVSPTEAGGDIQKALKHFPGTLKREKK
jgi:hypothetical protein